MELPAHTIDPIAIADRKVRISVSPGAGGLIETPASGQCSVRNNSEQGSFFGRVEARANERLRIYLLASAQVEDPTVLAGLLPDDADTQPLADLPGPTEAAVHAGGLNVSAVFCELTPDNCFAASPDEDLEAYCTLSISSHGYPTGVQIRGDEFFLPGRSCLPLGVVGEPQYLMQNIDMEPGDSLYFHTPIAEPGLLRKLHKDLTGPGVGADLEARLGIVRLDVE